MSISTRVGNLDGYAEGWFTALEDINAGDPVYVYEQRAVRKCKAVPGDLVDYSTNTYDMVAKRLNGTQVVQYYYDLTATQGYLVIGTHDGSGGMTWGTPVAFLGSAVRPFEQNIDILAINSTTFAICAGMSSGGVDVYVGTVSGSTISLGSSQATALADLYCTYPRLTNADTNKIVLAYHTTSPSVRVRAVAGTISGTTISWGTEQDVHTTDYCYYIDCSYTGGTPGNGGCISYYNNTTTFRGVWVVSYTLSGTVFTFGTKVQNHSGYAYNTRLTNIPGSSDKAVMLYGDSGYDQHAVVIRRSGTTTTIGATKYWAPPDDYAATYYGGLDNYYDSSERFGVFLAVGTNVGAAIRFGECDTGAVETLEWLIPAAKLYTGTRIYYTHMCIFDEDWAYISSGDSYTGTFQYQVVEIGGLGTAGLCIGIAQETRSAGQKINIHYLQSVSLNQSGLTPGIVYYIDDDGNLTDEITSYPIGTALSATDLFISKYVHPSGAV